MLLPGSSVFSGSGSLAGIFIRYAAHLRCSLDCVDHNCAVPEWWQHDLNKESYILLNPSQA